MERARASRTRRGKARPIVAVACCSRRLEGEIGQVVINRYLEALARYADCAPLLVPARPDLVDVADIANSFDGLLLTGSPSNVEPWRYGLQDAGAEGPFDPGRDTTSLALIRAMIDRALPILGICRGFQEINVAFGGTLRRDLASEGRALSHHAPSGVDLDTMFEHGHDVELARGGVLSTALCEEWLHVRSVHFQGVDKLGGGLDIEATAQDGVIEALSGVANGAPVLGIQWHPEWRTEDDIPSRRLFELFGRMLRDGPAAWSK